MFTLKSRITSSLAHRIEARLRRFNLPVRLVLHHGRSIDLGPDPVIALVFHRPGLLRLMLRGDLDRLEQAYVTGDLVVEGRIENVIEIGIELATRLGKSSWFWRLLNLPSRVPARRTRAAEAAQVQYHYDVSNEFYALWLDRRMIYSCAYFHTGQEDIDRAQEQKLEHICRKLRLRPGERLLDVGCGWGGLLEFAAKRCGISGVGITISRKQYEHAWRRIADEALGHRLQVRLQDYRDLAGESEFDKIVSVGMYEHVGHKSLPLYFATLNRVVKENGLVLNHGITTTDPLGRPQGPAGGSFIDRFVFPGGELPHISRVVQEMSRQGFDVIDIENLRPHYAATLAQWVRRLESQKARAVALAGQERHRIWRTYMAGCAVAFDRNWLSVYQVIGGSASAVVDRFTTMGCSTLRNVSCARFWRRCASRSGRESR